MDVQDARVALDSEDQRKLEAATRLGVRHETPQAIVLRDGKPVWKASHFRITADALTQALG